MRRDDFPHTLDADENRGCQQDQPDDNPGHGFRLAPGRQRESRNASPISATNAASASEAMRRVRLAADVDICATHLRGSLNERERAFAGCRLRSRLSK